MPRLVLTRRSPGRRSVSFAPLGGGAEDRVRHLGAAVAVLERRAVRRDGALARDRREQVRDLVGERVAPADDVTGRPPVTHERVLGLGDEHTGEVLLVRDLELVEPLDVEGDRPLRAVHLEGVVVDPAAGETRGLERADGAALELDGGDEVVVDLRGPGTTVRTSADTETMSPTR